jgi:hypothetical protein
MGMSIAKLAAEAFSGTCPRPLRPLTVQTHKCARLWPALFKLTNRAGKNLLDS